MTFKKWIKLTPCFLREWVRNLLAKGDTDIQIIRRLSKKPIPEQRVMIDAGGRLETLLSRRGRCTHSNIMMVTEQGFTTTWLMKDAWKT